jgi:hypothetical protein
MWAATATLPVMHGYKFVTMSRPCVPWGRETRFLHCIPEFPQLARTRGDYSADNSCRACSTRSRKLRSLVICRLTLSTLWITVE